jgi:hypothetical protein
MHINPLLIFQWMPTFEELAAVLHRNVYTNLQGLISECEYFFLTPVFAGIYYQGAPGKDTYLQLPFVGGLDSVGKEKIKGNLLEVRCFELGEHSILRGSISKQEINFEKRYINGTNTNGIATINRSVIRFHGKWHKTLYRGYWAHDGPETDLHNCGTFEIERIEGVDDFLDTLATDKRVLH